MQDYLRFPYIFQIKTLGYRAIIGSPNIKALGLIFSDCFLISVFFTQVFCMELSLLNDFAKALVMQLTLPQSFSKFGHAVKEMSLKIVN